MPPKKATKLKEKPQADPVIDPSAIPPALPPSVEEAYRRKCIQLKQRTNEVEEENDAARLRLARIRRQIEKMRVERAFLLEQLARRTSTNVEDSEGSPSPPPTVGDDPLIDEHPFSATTNGTPKRRRGPLLTPSQPREKPLRTKRGHRKPSILADVDAASKSARASPSAGEGLAPGSPGSEAPGGAANGAPKPPREPATAFESYCADTRSALVKAREEKGDETEADVDAEQNQQTVDEELAQLWKDLPAEEREQYETKRDDDLAKYDKEKEEYEQERKDYEEAVAKSKKAASKAKAAAKEEKAAAADVEDEEDEELKDAPAEKEDAEMKDDDKPNEEESVTAATISKPAVAATEAQDEDVEMGDNDTEAQQPDDTASADKAESKAEK